MSHYSDSEIMNNNHKRKGPLLYCDFGKNARDLITIGFCAENHVFQALTMTRSGLILTSTASTARRSVVGDTPSAYVKAQYNYKGASTDVRFHSSSHVLGHLKLTGQILPFTMARGSYVFSTHSFMGRRRYYDSGKLDILLSHRHATFGLSFTTESPVVGVLASVGCPSISFGIEGSMMPAFISSFPDWSARADIQFAMFHVGFQVTRPSWEASIQIANRGSMIKASYVHHLDKEKKISAAIELTRSFSTHETRLITGGSWLINHLTIAKARFDSRGLLTALLGLNFHAKGFLGISAEVITNNFSRKPRIGLAIALGL